jgi:PEP-CTERM motif
MKRFVLLAFLASVLPMAAWANEIDFGNSGGTLSRSNSGLSLTDSTLTTIKGLNGSGLITGSNLGGVYFTTGALTSGSLASGATFAAGGSFTISGTNGVIFNGSFSSPVTWTMWTLANGTHGYTLEGTISGGGMYGLTTQLTVNTGKGFFSGSALIDSGNTNVVVPEPGTLGLLGSGLVSIAGLVRRRMRT